ncbi:MAG: thymidine phosphorylase [Actinobacteria bacterium]|nr:thymidine phosphorylase [Actinomycetota bacterium]
MIEPFSTIDLISTKRDFGELSKVEIDWIIDAYVRGVVADEQMSAMAMAILLNGMSMREIVDWTQAMINSGERLDFSSLSPATVDKHSTGGVGDMITLPLAPLVASFGAAVPQLSGRGLGHTGGTLDKLEAIPGWQANLTNEQMLNQLHQVGAVICAAGAGLAPADKKLYALRDVTGTVPAIPLIASSIMSKKIAEGTSALVLDVKVGSGAFMKTIEQARTLAKTMVEIGNAAGVKTKALLTNMEQPLGKAAGNALEVRQAIEVLNGAGPQDVIDLTVELATQMLALVGITGIDVKENLENGKALAKWQQLISAQNGDLSKPLPAAKFTHEIYAADSGTIAKFDALSVGIAAWRLGAGRSRKEDSVQAAAGVTWTIELGQKITKGEPILTLHTDEESRFDSAIAALESSVVISQGESVAKPNLILDRIGE